MAIHEGFQGVCILHPLGVSILTCVPRSPRYGRGKNPSVVFDAESIYVLDSWPVPTASRSTSTQYVPDFRPTSLNLIPCSTLPSHTITLARPSPFRVRDEALILVLLISLDQMAVKPWWVPVLSRRPFIPPRTSISLSLVRGRSLPISRQRRSV
jgi:hypothetical protein